MLGLAARWERLRDARLPYAPPRRRRAATAYIVGLLIGGGLIAALLIAVTIAFLPSQAPPSATAPSPNADVALLDPSMHVNELGGYSFAAPAGWVIEDRGSASRLTSPDEDVVMSFGAGRSGSLDDALQALMDSIRRVYANVNVGAPQATEIDRRPALMVSGSLENAADVQVRFLGIAIQLGGQNRLIGVFVSQPADPAEVLPAVEDVIGSFEAA